MNVTMSPLSNHDIIVRFWFATTALLSFFVVVAIVGNKLLFALVCFILAVVALIREWLAENDGVDAKVSMSDFFSHVGLIVLTGLSGPILILAYPYLFYSYIKARRSRYY